MAGAVVHAQAPSPRKGRSANEWLEEAWRLKREGDATGAERAFEQARRAGADGQRIDVELGYLLLSQGQKTRAAARFRAASNGPDPQLAETARAELRVLPARFWGDLYGEGVGW